MASKGYEAQRFAGRRGRLASVCPWFTARLSGADGHTPNDEIVRVYTGNAFDIAGERRQTKFDLRMMMPGGYFDESVEVKLRNHKNESATVRVVEHLYRWMAWAISEESAPHRPVDSKTIEYEVNLQPNEEKALTYSVHYTW